MNIKEFTNKKTTIFITERSNRRIKHQRHQGRFFQVESKFDRLEARILLTADLSPLAISISDTHPSLAGDSGLVADHPQSESANHELAGLDSEQAPPPGGGGLLPGLARSNVDITRDPTQPPTGSTANLQITGLTLVDAYDHPIAAPVVGQMVFAQANWRSDNLSAGDSYLVRFNLDGIALDSGVIQGSPGQGLTYYWWLGGWFASPGQHTLTATIDGANTVAESNESDNSSQIVFQPAAVTTLPFKLVTPVGGTPFSDWAIVNYLDVDPRPGIKSDYMGGSFVYDGHNGMDIALPNTSRMDDGLPVLAAAAGTVIQLQDGNFDRETTANFNPANYIVIDHGNGWTTTYYHLARNTTAVRVGDTVVAGQQIAMVGSSGSSTEAHLHFSLSHDGALVETFYDPSDYWVSPLPYEGSTATVMTDYGITNYGGFSDFPERPTDVSVFPTSTNWSVYYWDRSSHFNAGDVLRIVWRKPDGSAAATYNYNITSTQQHPFFNWALGKSTWSTALGTWSVSTLINGVLNNTANFQVTSGTGASVIRVTQGATYITNGRTTPVDFGSIAVGGAAPTLTFTLFNKGSATLSTSNLSLPPGFSLVGSFPAAIAAGSNAPFTVQLDTTLAGTKFGAVRLSSDDPEAPTVSFNLTGMVTGSPPAGSPVLTLPGAAVVGFAGGIPRILDAGATLTDSDSANFNGGQLVVEYASGGDSRDRLSVRNQGSGAGQIGVQGSSVTFGGLVIGTLAGGTGLNALVIALNAGATPIATQSLIRAITYEADTPTPATPPRYVRLTLTDDTGKTSNQPIKVVLQNYLGGLSALESGGSTIVAEAGATDSYALTLNIRPSADVTINLSPSGSVTVSPQSITFTPQNWNTPQSVVVTAVDDAISQGTHYGTIAQTATSSDPAYTGLTLPSVTATVLDNDPKFILTGLAGDGQTGLTFTYQIQNAASPPATISVYRSTTLTPGVNDTLLGSLSLSDAADLTVGNHAKTFSIGSGGLPLPGAGAAEVDTDYFIVGLVTGGDGATIPLTGVYHAPGGSVMVQGGASADTVSVSQNTPSLSFNGNTYTYAVADVTGIRIRAHAGNDAVSLGGGLPVATMAWGGADGNTLTGPSVAATFNITAADSGTAAGATTFSNFKSLIGGAGNDLFKFSAGGSLTGGIDGAGGANTIDQSAVTTPISANLTTKNLTGLGTTFSNIQSLLGGTAANNLTGPAAASTFNITGSNAGNVAGVSFAKYRTLIGGAGNDVFAFGSSAFLGGFISGGGGAANTLDYSAFSTQVTLDMFHSASSRLTLGYVNIQNVIAGSFAGNQLLGPHTSTNYFITGANSGNTNGVTFSNFARLVAGPGNDTFKFSNAASLSSSIEGDNGTNTLDFSAYTTPVIANFGASTITGIGGTYTNIRSISGGTAANTITGPVAGSTYTITGTNTAIVGPLTFAKFGAINGNAGDDTFVFGPAAVITGAINGGGGNNTFDYSAMTTQVNVNLATSAASRVTNPFSGIENFIGGGFAGNQLTGPAAGATFNVTGASTGNVAGKTFSSFGRLIGGAGNDTFVMSNGATLTSGIDGGGGSNWLDYGAYTTNVSVNLTTGAATGLAASAVNIGKVRGGSGNDTLTGNSAGNVLIGGAGNDTLIGGSGRSLLIGGTGVDTVTGGSGDDIVIGGLTTFDNNFTALDSILAEWKSTVNNYATRVSLIKNGGGLNGTNKLILGTTVIDDLAANVLTGNAGNDWFFKGTNDSIADLQAGEQVN